MIQVNFYSLLCERDRGMKDVMLLGFWQSIPGPPERCYGAAAGARVGLGCRSLSVHCSYPRSSTSTIKRVVR